MNVKTILVAASGGSANDGAVELGCNLSRRFGCHLEAFHVRPDPRDLFLYSGDAMGSISAEFLDRFIQDADAMAQKTKKAFEAAIARHHIGVCTTPSAQLSSTIEAGATWRDDTGYAPALVSRRSRFFDIVVLGRSERVINEPYTDVVEETLINSGRPVLLAPAKPQIDIGNVVAVAWDGSAPATRAVSSSLPFLATARAVTIFTVGNEHMESAKSVVEYLSWRGINSNYRQVALVPGAGPGQQIIPAALDENADLLVMGGYGHMPWREFLFGGVTRNVIKVGLLPILLTH